MQEGKKGEKEKKKPTQASKTFRNLTFIQSHTFSQEITHELMHRWGEATLRRRNMPQCPVPRNKNLVVRQRVHERDSFVFKWQCKGSSPGHRQESTNSPILKTFACIVGDKEKGRKGGGGGLTQTITKSANTGRLLPWNATTITTQFLEECLP